MRALVIGDAMWDLYDVVEPVDKPNPDEPTVPRYRLTKTIAKHGGADNVLSNVYSISNSDESWGLFGQGRPLRRRITLNGESVLYRLDVDSPVSPINPDRINVDKSWDCVIISDYGKGSITSDVVHRLRILKRISPCPFFVDTKLDPLVWDGIADWYFPNEVEENTFRSSYRMLRNVVLKKGPHGASIIRPTLEHFAPFSSHPVSAASQARIVVNPTGAGDTVVAAFAIAMVASSCNLQDRLHFAMAAAAITVESPLTYAPNLEEIRSSFGSSRIIDQIRKNAR